MSGFFKDYFSAKAMPQAIEQGHGYALNNYYKQMQEAYEQQQQDEQYAASQGLFDQIMNDPRIDPTRKLFMQYQRKMRNQTGFDTQASQFGSHLQTRADQMYKRDNPLRSNSAKIAMDLGLRPGTAEFNNFVQRHAMKAGTQVTIGGDSGFDNLMLPNDPRRASAGIAPEDKRTWQYTKNGGWKPMNMKDHPAEGAGKLAMLRNTAKGFKIIDDLMFLPDGNIDYDLLDTSFKLSMAEWMDPTESNTLGKKFLKFFGEDPVAMDNAERLRQAWTTGIHAITRLETGAAMRDEEIKSTMQRFMPSAEDGPGAIMQKYRAFQYFINSAIENIDPSKMNAKEIGKDQADALLTDFVLTKADEALNMYKVNTNKGGRNPDNWKEGDGPEPGVYWE